MSAPTRTAPTARAVDVRTVRRVGAAVLLPLGPLSVAVIRGILPYQNADDTAAMLADTAANQARMDAVLWLSVLAMLTLIPSALAAGRAAQRRAPVLALIGLCLLVPGYATLFFAIDDSYARSLAAEGIGTGTAVRVLEAHASLAPVGAAAAVFVLGHVLGLIVLGAALWRARAVPAWAGAAIIASQPLHIVFAVVVPHPLFDALAWGLAVIGMAAAAVGVLRTSNDDWDLAPASH
ncbi:hypothetical protein [Nocardiopsis aegyptia]|uniref:DUF4386 family protein n=1 Tax=Nocardiopsis aegyptia TaxID=220378 RepID=A0A7Z0ENC4_9ACTN|nr:hypothetical protein [Nocardiopsis aegyptia]NYJ34375.1 hypothetical protein [Nocardiopsis aegyptia]